jgi:hypothetical protein
VPPLGQFVQWTRELPQTTFLRAQEFIKHPIGSWCSRAGTLPVAYRAPTKFDPEEGSSMYLQNFDNIAHIHTMWQRKNRTDREIRTHHENQKSLNTYCDMYSLLISDSVSTPQQ